MKTKELSKYIDQYCVLVPVYYMHESKPAWRKYFIGSKEECTEIFSTAPDYLKATPEEEAKNLYWKTQEAAFLDSIGEKAKAAAIKAQYQIGGAA